MAWHSNPNPRGYTLADANVPYTAHGRTGNYPTAERSPAGAWLRENPHDQPLPQIALERIAGAPILPTEVGDIVQTLDLWSGILRSRYALDGQPVQVTVANHPTRDVLAVRVESLLLARGKLAVRIALPRGHEIKTKNNPALDWTQPESHHTEMLWWHTAHFSLWGRDALLAGNLDWFVRALPIARELARSRELHGARWAKMIGPDGRESPGGNPLIVWNQPHPIHLAELLYRSAPTPATLSRYRELVQETAECLASMLHWDEAKRRFNLRPPLWIAQEIYDRATSMNPTYELSFWERGLKIAQLWRERLQLTRDPEWDRRIRRIAALPTSEGKYVAMESTPDTWQNKDSRHDHPSFLMALGQLPGDGVDLPTMRRTLDAVIASWDWEAKIWGWDYPMIAMTAARLGEARKAVDILLFAQGPNNAYTASGHCPQRADLPVYLPANGALLAAVALMAAGWDGAPTHDAPGFPRDGSWVVRREGLRPLP